MRILIVDEEQFAEKLSSKLKGHRCNSVRPPEALESLATQPYDLAIVDADSEESRMFLTTYRRSAPRMSVIAISAQPSLGAAVELLRGGAAAEALDYIDKSAADLAGRINDVLSNLSRIENGLWAVDLEARRGYYDGEALDLTEREYDLFRTFMDSPYRELSYTDLAAAVYGRQKSSEDAYTSLRSLVSRLRTKTWRAAGYNVLSRHADGAGIRFVPSGVGPRRRDISKS